MKFSLFKLERTGSKYYIQRTRFNRINTYCPTTTQKVIFLFNEFYGQIFRIFFYFPFFLPLLFYAYMTSTYTSFWKKTWVETKAKKASANHRTLQGLEKMNVLVKLHIYLSSLSGPEP